jgi:hypothetical protein
MSDEELKTKIEETTQPESAQEDGGDLDFNLSFKPGEIAERSIVDEMKSNYIAYSSPL